MEAMRPGVLEDVVVKVYIVAESVSAHLVSRSRSTSLLIW